MRNDSFESHYPGTRPRGDDRSAQTRLAARAIDCGDDCVHDGELEPRRQDTVPTKAPERERTRD
jgi:hypothetical protein